MLQEDKFILFTDIDGTLLDKERLISQKNVYALAQLRNTFRVAISGRNMVSAHRVLPENLPIDYLVFSNGAGVEHWQSGEIIYKKHIEDRIFMPIVDFLISRKITFTVHRPIPDMHYYMYYIGSYKPADLSMRNDYYRDFVTQLSIEDLRSWKEATCIICMLPQEEVFFEQLKQDLMSFSDEISITRTTSPFTHKNIWLEIYHKQVNKGRTAEFLCKYLDIPVKNTVGIGNDYNDLSLLEFVNSPFVVDNAPDELKKQFPATVDHNNSAVAKVIELARLT